MSDPCVWKEDEDSVWHTDCDHLFEVANQESPSDNGFKFCCYCGGELVESGYEEQESK